MILAEREAVGRQNLVRVEFGEVSACRQTRGQKSIRGPTCRGLTVNAEPAHSSCGPGEQWVCH